MFYDYLLSNFDSYISISRDSKTWATSANSLNRINYLDDLHDLSDKVIKTITLFEMFNGITTLYPSSKNIAVSINSSDKDVKECLEKLIDKKILIYKKHFNYYSLFEGSDFNIEDAIADAKTKVSDRDNISVIDNFFNNSYVIAKRHYHEYGSIRWFNISTVRAVSEIKERKFNENNIGTFFYIIPSNEKDYKEIKSALYEFSNRTCYVVLENYNYLNNYLEELQCLQWVQDNDIKLHGDAIARREVESRLSYLFQELKTLVHVGLETSSWIYSQETIKLDHNSYSKFVSNIADELYKNCPKITSELLNRTKPSGTANGAAAALIKQMFKREGEDNLGFEDGYPAARGLFESIVSKNGLYKNNAFKYPDKSSSLHYMWKMTDKRLKDSSSNVDLPAIYKMWSSEIGLKAGLHNLMMSLYIATNKDKIATYVENVYQTELNDVFCDFISRTPKYISVRYVDSDNEDMDYLEAINNVISEVIGKKFKYNKSLKSFELVKILINFVYSLNGWVLKTSRINRSTLLLREKLKNAHDPNNLIYDVIPHVYNSTTADFNGWINDFKESLRELKDAYPDLINDFASLIVSELGYSGLDKNAIADIKQSAVSVRGKSGDFRLDGFATRMAGISDDSVLSLDPVISMSVSKPIDKWIDTDINRAKLSLYELLASFKRVVKLSKLKSSDDNFITLVLPNDGDIKMHSYEPKANQKAKPYIAEMLKDMKTNEAVACLLDICNDIIKGDK